MLTTTLVGDKKLISSLTNKVITVLLRSNIRRKACSRNAIRSRSIWSRRVSLIMCIYYLYQLLITKLYFFQQTNIKTMIEENTQQMRSRKICTPNTKIDNKFWPLTLSFLVLDFSLSFGFIVRCIPNLSSFKQF